MVALSRIGIVGTGHDDRELSLEPELQGPDKHADELLVDLFIDWGEIVGGIEEIHRIWCRLHWKG